jgi:hypothetical protein
LKLTVPEHAPPVIVSPEKLTLTVPTMENAVPPPEHEPHVRLKVGLMGETRILLPLGNSS